MIPPRVFLVLGLSNATVAAVNVAVAVALRGDPLAVLNVAVAAFALVAAWYALTTWRLRR